MPHKLCSRRREKKQLRQTKATNIPNRTSIHERPAEANGKRFGDWEMDLIVDSRQRVILTLVERSVRYMSISPSLRMVKCPLWCTIRHLTRTAFAAYDIRYPDYEFECTLLSLARYGLKDIITWIS